MSKEQSQRLFLPPKEVNVLFPADSDSENEGPPEPSIQPNRAGMQSLRTASQSVFPGSAGFSGPQHDNSGMQTRSYSDPLLKGIGQAKRVTKRHDQDGTQNAEPPSVARGELLTRTSNDAGLAPVPLYAHLNSGRKNSSVNTHQKKLNRSKEWVGKAENFLLSYFDLNPNDDLMEKEVLQVRFYRGLVDRNNELTSGQMEKCRQIINRVDRRTVVGESETFFEQSTENNRKRFRRGMAFDGRKCLLGEDDDEDLSAGEDNENEPDMSFTLLSSRRSSKTQTSSSRRPRGVFSRPLSSAIMTASKSSLPRTRGSTVKPHPATCPSRATSSLSLSPSPSPSRLYTAEGHPKRGGKSYPVHETSIENDSEQAITPITADDSHPTWSVKTVPCVQNIESAPSEAGDSTNSEFGSDSEYDSQIDEMYEEGGCAEAENENKTTENSEAKPEEKEEGTDDARRWHFVTGLGLEPVSEEE